VEDTYNGKEEGLFQEQGKQSVEKGEPAKAGRKPMGRGENWEDGREEVQGLAVGELGGRMAAE